GGCGGEPLLGAAHPGRARQAPPRPVRGRERRGILRRGLGSVLRDARAPRARLSGGLREAEGLLPAGPARAPRGGAVADRPAAPTLSAAPGPRACPRNRPWRASGPLPRRAPCRGLRRRTWARHRAPPSRRRGAACGPSRPRCTGAWPCSCPRRTAGLHRPAVVAGRKAWGACAPPGASSDRRSSGGVLGAGRLLPGAIGEVRAVVALL